MSSPHQRRRRMRAITVAGAAVVLALVPVVAAFTGTASVATGVAATLSSYLVAAGLVLLFGPALRLGRAGTGLLLVSSLLACTGWSLFGISFAVGMNEGDAGRPHGLLGTLTPFLLLVATLCTTLAAGIVYVQLLRRTPLPAWLVAVIAVPATVTVTPALFICFLSPQTPLVAAIALLVVIALTGPRIASVPVRTPAAPPRLTARVRLLALGFLLFTTVVWVGGIAASVAGSGTPTATSALGQAAATGQLAALPLIVAVTMLVTARAPGGAARTAAVLVIVVVATASVLMLAGYDPASDSFVMLAGVIALAVGVWIGVLFWQFGGSRVASDRGVAAAGCGLAGAVLYLACAFSGGLGLLLVSGLLLFGGRMFVPGRERERPVSPARPAVSS